MFGLLVFLIEFEPLRTSQSILKGSPDGRHLFGQESFFCKRTFPCLWGGVFLYAEKYKEDTAIRIKTCFKIPYS